ncbi:hypothetical protein FHW12_000895 [Dokdonella fugitiva]|uniref:Parallel beta helix pectate lyase-like protein n=2 Tax=Dokdonella fugitiva TaxID=328517 RepID=A0A839F337_9GAMM|nr:hypothetical protein [Dokdonella fugitiva]
MLRCFQPAVFGAAVLIASPAAMATVSHCVGNASQLQGAFTAAATNGEADFVKLRSGVITPATTLAYRSNVAGADQLPLIVDGGYNSDCSARTGETFIDGDGALRPFLFEFGGADFAVIQHLTVMRGFGGEFVSAGGNMAVYLYDQGGGADVRIEAVRFLLGHSEISAGALAVNGWGTFTLRNSLFNGNEAPGMAALSINLTGEAHVVNNTIAHNVRLGGQGGAAVYSNPVTAASHAEFANNIIWDNDNVAFDLYMLNGDRHALLDNDIGSHTSLPPQNETGELSIDPEFGDCGALCVDLPLSAGSPLTNQGENDPTAGIGAEDLLGRPRVAAQRVDIGAYELDRLFDDGFD